MKTQQALVAVGGRASRLQEVVASPMAKSFIEIEGRPVLFWCLRSLHAAGVREVVLAGNEDAHLERAEQVVSDLPFTFDNTHFFQDEGTGVYGLPNQARHLLDDRFFLEYGHGLNAPGHYQAMDGKKGEDNVVFSAYWTHDSNLRQQVELDRGRVVLAADNDPTGIALATPLLVNQAYANRLPSLGFNVRRILGYYAATSQIAYVWSEMPPEFDTPSELEEARVCYSRLVRSQLNES